MVQLNRGELIGSLCQDFRSFTLVNPKKKVPFRDVTSGVIDMIVVHCTDATNWSPEQLGNFFVQERGFPICGYHYYVRSEAVYQMTGENVLGYHAAGYNTRSIGISMDFAPTKMEPLNIAIDPIVFENCQKMVTYLALKYRVPPKMVKFHRELFGTGWIRDKNDKPALRKTCPGMSLDPDVFRYSIARRMQTAWNLPGVAVDGLFGPISKKTLTETLVDA